MERGESQNKFCFSFERERKGPVSLGKMREKFLERLPRERKNRIFGGCKTRESQAGR